MSPVPQIFDRRLLRQRRNRAAAGFEAFDVVFREAADRLTDRLDDVQRSFPVAVDLGCHTGILSPPTDKIGTMIRTDLSSHMLNGLHGPLVVCDEEWLPFADNSVDLVMSCLSLHWVNDLPGTLAQIYRMLKPDGLFLACLPGTESLRELQASIVAVSEVTGLSARVSPFIDVRDGGALLQRAGFALPVVDSEMLTVTYPTPLDLMRELRGSGESNALTQRHKQFTSPGQLFAIARHYMVHFAEPDGHIPATLELVTLTGWKPHESQQKPAKRGSGKLSLVEALKS